MPFEQGEAPSENNPFPVQVMASGGYRLGEPVSENNPLPVNVVLGGGDGGPRQIAINVQAATTYTPTLADAFAFIQRTSADPQSLTVPAYSSVAYPVGSVLTIEQTGVGELTILPEPGVTLNLAADLTNVTAGQFAVVQLIKTAQDVWSCFGGFAPA